MEISLFFKYFVSMCPANSLCWHIAAFSSASPPPEHQWNSVKPLEGIVIACASFCSVTVLEVKNSLNLIQNNGLHTLFCNSDLLKLIIHYTAEKQNKDEKVNKHFLTFCRGYGQSKIATLDFSCSVFYLFILYLYYFVVQDGRFR